MQEEAEHHKVEDQKKAELIQARNQADAIVAAAEKALKDAGDKAPVDVKTKVEDKVKGLKDVLAKEGSGRLSGLGGVVAAGRPERQCAGPVARTMTRPGSGRPNRFQRQSLQGSDSPCPPPRLPC